MSIQDAERLIPIEDLEKGARDFEVFWLRPQKMANKEVILRMEIKTRWGGWKLKDGLVKSLGLVVGDTINTEVSVLNAPGLIDDKEDTDLFACGAGADWLLENDIGFGSVIDAKVKFVYAKAPVGGLEGKEVWKISLVFVEGYHIEKKRDLNLEHDSIESISSLAALKKLLEE